MSQQFYSKYRHLFEDEMFDQIQKGYDMKIPIPTQVPQLKFTVQQPKLMEHSPQKQESSPYKMYQQQSQYIPQQPQQYQNQQNDRSVQSRKNQNDERIRKQVMQDNIFKQPASESRQQPERTVPQHQPSHQQNQDAPLLERKFQQQTYNVFQDQDILDDYAPKKQKPVISIPVDTGHANNIHKVYLQRLQDLEYIRRKYVDPKQLSRDIDQNNPYKAALMERILAQFDGNQRKARLKEALKT